MRASERKEEYLVPDLVALVPSVERSQGSDPTADAHTVLRRECDASVLDTLRRQPQEVLIMGAENPAHGRCPLQVKWIVTAQKVEIASRQGIDSRKAQLTSHLGGHVLVEVETQLAQAVVQRPWAANCWRRSSACSALDRISASIAALFW